MVEAAGTAPRVLYIVYVTGIKACGQSGVTLNPYRDAEMICQATFVRKRKSPAA
jgi:hypothetical protein